MLKEISDKIKELKKLTHVSHYYCDDPYYSCPLAEDPSMIYDNKDKLECSCGADIQNLTLQNKWKELENLIEGKP